MRSDDFFFNKIIRRLIILNLYVLFSMTPLENILETLSGINTSNFAQTAIAVMGEAVPVAGNPKSYGSSSTNICIQNFKYDLGGMKFDGYYKVFGNAYYYGCRPGIDTKYKVGEHIRVYIGKNETNQVDFSRWGFQSWFLLQQLVYCLIFIAIFVPWFISTLDKPLPWWLRSDNNPGNEK